MKLTAKVTPYSSIVGTSVWLSDEKGQNVAGFSLLSVGSPHTTHSEQKANAIALAEAAAKALDGLEVDLISASS
jgi:hypothetical protein